MDSAYIVTFIGDDRPGLVEELSRVIERNGGNWRESRLSQLGGKFAGLVLVSLPQSNTATLEQELSALAASGLSVSVNPTASALAPADNIDLRLNVIGPDRPGIVKEVSRALAERTINVVEMDSHVAPAAMSAENLFNATICASVPADTNLDSLSDSLDEIANQMTLDIEFERS